MSDDVRAQSLINNILKPSGQSADQERLRKAVEQVDVSNGALKRLVERRMQPMTQAQKLDWLMDATTVLIAIEARKRLEN